jgi:hypothetical protein
VGNPTLAADSAGKLPLVWGQTETLPDPDMRPPIQSRHHLYAIRSDDGSGWSAPAPLDLDPPIGSTTHMALPALANDGEDWWLLTYMADDAETRVVLFRSRDRGESFQLDRTLATRSVPADRFALGGSYTLALCDDVAHAGHYVGLAAAQSRVVAAFVLPETDEPLSRATAYVAVVDPS